MEWFGVRIIVKIIITRSCKVTITITKAKHSTVTFMLHEQEDVGRKVNREMQCAVSPHDLRWRQACNASSNTYGSGSKDIVEKLCCIGHTGKRMFRALESFRISHKGKLFDEQTVGIGKDG